MSVVRSRQNMWATISQYLILGPRSGIWNTAIGLASLYCAWERVINLRMGSKNNPQSEDGVAKAIACKFLLRQAPLYPPKK